MLSRHLPQDVAPRKLRSISEIVIPLTLSGFDVSPTYESLSIKSMTMPVYSLSYALRWSPYNLFDA